MTVADDLVTFPWIPADVVPFGGAQLEALKRTGQFQDAVRGGYVTATRPGWVHDRVADAWLVSRDSSTACPLLWDDDGRELIVSVVVERSPKPPSVLRIQDVPARGAVPLAGRRVEFSRHATRLWAEQLPDPDLNALLAAESALVTRQRPKWIRRRDKESAFLILAHGRIIAPLRHGGLDQAAIATGLFLASAVQK